MHIVFDYQIFSLQQFGGVSRYFLELAEKLSMSDLELSSKIVAPYHVNSLLEAGAKSGKVAVVGRKIPPFPGKHHVLPVLNRFASRAVLLHEQPDIIHETYYSDHGLKCKCPRILTVFDMIHERFPQYFEGVDRLVPQLKAKAVARADHVIAISKSTRDDIVKFLNVDPEKITVVHLASSLEKPEKTKSNEERRHPYLLYVGLRRGVKNFYTLLQAYMHSKVLHSDFDLVCVGGEKFSPDEKRAINDAGLANKVVQVDADDSSLASLYADAAVFVYPSLYEGFGIPILEAMRCGCPVVCSNTSSIPEIAGDGALYFDPENQEELRSVLESVISSENRASQLRQKGYVQEEKFSWETCARNTSVVYKQYV